VPGGWARQLVIEASFEVTGHSVMGNAGIGFPMAEADR
jgi:hypothetical protein